MKESILMIIHIYAKVSNNILNNNWLFLPHIENTSLLPYKVNKTMNDKGDDNPIRTEF